VNVGEPGTGARFQSTGDRPLDQTAQIQALVLVAALGIAAVVIILRRDRVTLEEATRETRFAVATEGMKRCPSCGMGNLVTDDTCSNCGKRLPG
jgi:hypothetical protein